MLSDKRFTPRKGESAIEADTTGMNWRASPLLLPTSMRTIVRGSSATRMPHTRHCARTVSRRRRKSPSGPPGMPPCSTASTKTRNGNRTARCASHRSSQANLADPHPDNVRVAAETPSATIGGAAGERPLTRACGAASDGFDAAINRPAAERAITALYALTGRYGAGQGNSAGAGLRCRSGRLAHISDVNPLRTPSTGTRPL